VTSVTSPATAHFDSHISHLSQARAERNRPYGYGRHNPSPFEDDEKRLESEKDLVPALNKSVTARAFGGTHGPGVHSRVPRNSFLQKWFPKSWPCRLLYLVVFLEAVINIAIQANILWRFQNVLENNPDAFQTDVQKQNQKRLPVYLYIFVTAQ